MCAPSPLNRLLSLFPLWPLLVGVVTGVCIADHNATNWWQPISIVGFIVAISIRKLPVTLIVLGILLGLGSHGLVIKNQKTWIETIKTNSHNPKVKLTGTIIHTGSDQTGPFLIKVKGLDRLPSGDQLPPNVQVLLQKLPPGQAPLKYGDLIQINGKIIAVSPKRNPYGFDRQKWLHRQGANFTIHTQEPISIIGVNPLRRPVRIMSDWRYHLRKKMTAGLPSDSQEAQLIRAVVLGESPPKPSSLIDDFRNSGTLHVFAVSGLHVGMVGTILGALLWFLRAPRWALIGGIILGMAIYAGITGLRPPAVRAVIMASFFLSGFLIQRRPSLINSLAASAIIVLLWDGHQLFTPGFQLSYGVLLMLAIAAGFWVKILKPMAEIDPFMPRLLLTPSQERFLNGRKWLRNSLSVSLAAWMGSAPLMWIHFGIITPIAVIAGIPLMFMVFLILALAMLGLVAGSAWSPAGETVNQANALVAKATYSTAAMFADIPGSHWLRQPARPDKGRIIVFDIPYGGGANLIDIGGGIMLDCGRRDHFYRHVLPTLTALRLHPDSLIVSHADSKHSGGMSHCLSNFHAKQAIIPRIDLLSRSYRDFLVQAAASDCKLIIPRAGERFPIEDGVSLEILHAPVELEGKGRADDTGLVIRLHWHGWRILFTGDAGFITESRLLNSGLDLQADVIITGRNRDDFTGREDFYQAVGPKAIISSNCSFPEQERIPERWFKMTKNLNITTFNQQQTGAITLTIEDDNLVLVPTLNPSTPHIITR